MNNRLCGLALLVALASTAAQAIIVLPGQRVGRGTLDVFADNPTLITSLTLPVNSLSGAVFGTMTSAVYRNQFGTLDFYYQYVNGAGSDPINRITMNSFRGFTTDVGYRTTAIGPFVAGTVEPDEANRSFSGSVVGFDFDPPVAIPSGATSRVLVVRTNATDFRNGWTSVINGGATTVAAFAPVPEPTTLGALALGALGLLRRRKR
jgi:hypothetical protein